METIKTILHDFLPCWYELSWRELMPPSLILRVHKDFIKEIEEEKFDFRKAPIVMGLKAEFGFEEFIGDFSGNFGFDSALERMGENDEFVEFMIRIPKVKQRSGRDCDRCNGSGKEEFLNGECLQCGGKGKKYIYGRQPAYAISASLNVFFNLALFPKKQTRSSIQQLMTIHVVTYRDMHGGSLSGEYGIPLVRWLSSFPSNTFLPKIQNAMASAYHHLVGLSDFDLYDFRANIADNKGWLNISCPGDACGLHPSGSYKKDGDGYEFSCHNVDSPMQQITLLAGLASLNDMARESLNNR